MIAAYPMSTKNFPPDGKPGHFKMLFVAKNSRWIILPVSVLPDIFTMKCKTASVDTKFREVPHTAE
jgi:hypothetical protein